MSAIASRQGAVARALAYCEGGSFERDLEHRVAIRTESQKGAAVRGELQRYLDEAMQPAFEAMAAASSLLFIPPTANLLPRLPAARIIRSVIS